MEKKAKMGMDPITIIGAVFMGMGMVFVILGACLAIGLREQGQSMIGVIFLVIGLPFLMIGVVFLIITYKKIKRANEMLASGRYVWAQVVDLSPNLMVTINGRHPMELTAAYIDAKGMTHVFRASSNKLVWDSRLLEQQVKVYYEDLSFRHYYVDLENILSKYIIH